MIGMYSRRRRLTAAVWFVLAIGLVGVLVGGCSQRAPSNLPRLFGPIAFDPQSPHAYQLGPKSKYVTHDGELVKLSKKKLPRMDNADFAMLAANHAMVDEAVGDIPGAFQAAMDSQRVMTGIVKGEKGKGVAAAIADESFKVFKGECYEIAMLNSLLGLYSLRMGDNETAGIGFRRAIEADKMSKKGLRDDFRLAFWGLGMATVDSDPEAAGVMFGKCGYKSPEEVAAENLVVLISIGRPPWKRLVGLYGEYDSLTMANYEPRSAEVIVDGKSLGQATSLINLFTQSKGVSRSGKDVGQGAKAVGKAALAIFAGVLGGSNAMKAVENAYSIKADTRTCYMLPNEIHALSAKLTPGMHTVRVKFRNAEGVELPRYEQVWHYVQAPKTGRNYLAVRSEFDRCNVQGPIAFTRVNKAKTDKKSNVTTIRFRVRNLPGVGVGDKLQVCHFYRLLENRWDMQYNWRYTPMAYNNKGEAIGYPGAKHRMQDYEIGLIGVATVTEIKGDQGMARMESLTTDYVPQPDDMVTAARKQGRLWR